MRLGVLDVGSNTVHLLVVDAHPGARPIPAFSHKVELQLVQLIGPDGAITDEGAERLESFIEESVAIAEDKGVEEFIGFATSADGLTWTRHDDRAGIDIDPDSWEGSMICYPFVFDSEIGRVMLYNGGRYGDAGFGIAVLEQE